MYEGMHVYDASFAEIETPDTEKGSLEFREVGVTHKWVVDTEEEGHWEVIQEYENGGQDVEWRVDKPEAGHWETTRESGEVFTGYPGLIAEDWPHDMKITDTYQYLLYTPYTEEELAQIAADKAEAERQAQIAALKRQLADTDYVVTKMSEYSVSGTEMPEDDAERYAGIIEQRAQWRAQINELEAQDA